MPSNHLILCHPLLQPSIIPSIRAFSNGSVLHIRRPKYWSFSFGISPFNEYAGLISFRMDWLDLLAVQGTLKSSPVATSASYKGLPQWFSGKEFACSAGHPSSISGSERSPGGGHGTHSMTLAWRIPWTEEPGELQSIGSKSQTRLKRLSIKPISSEVSITPLLFSP